MPEAVPPSGTVVEESALAAPLPMRPGEGVAVRVAVSARSGSAFWGAVYRRLLGELGFAVSGPAELVVGSQSVAYLYLAEGGFDVWLDGRFPYDEVWLEGSAFDGSRVGNHVVVLGGRHRADALSGWLISKGFADEHGVYTLDALDRDPAAVAAFDESDVVPGNGKADILAWPEGTIPGDLMAAQAAFSGWDSIAVRGLGEDERVAHVLDAVARGVPVIAVANTPSRLVGLLRPGREVYWLGVEEFLDGSNPLGHPQGDLFWQWTRGLDGAGGYAPFGVDECPAAARDVRGLCPVGWVTSTRTVAANAGFAAANPAAAVLLDAVFVPAADVSQALLREADGSAPADLAAEWIAANRALADEWLAAARTAAAAG